MTSNGRCRLRLFLFLALTLSLTAACSGTFQRGATPSVFVRNTGQENLIVFFHGVLGDAESTWRNPETGAYWPEMITRDADFNAFDVYVLNYESPFIARTSTIEEIAQRALQQLRDRNIFVRYKQIFFVTHSMGGLVAKRLLVELNRPTEVDNLRRVRAVLYISTPAQGAQIAELGKWLSLNPQFKDMEPADLNSFLQALDNQWQNLIRDRDTTGALFPKSYCAYETKPTHGIMIVSRVYAATRCDLLPYAIDLDHIAIAKPASDQVDPYTWSKARIFEAAERKLILESLPKADPHRFAVAVVHLENDTQGEYERMIVEALSELEGVEVLRFDRTITAEGPRPQEAIRKAHDEVRDYLAASGAHLLIWGSVLRRDGKGMPKLRWTASSEIGFEKQARNYDPTGIELPGIFWSDMAEVLKLLVLSYDAEFRALEGRFIGDKLGPFIEKVRRLLNDRQSQRGWSAEARLQVTVILADSLLMFGEQAGKTESLVDAVAIYREALKERTRERVPLDWAMTQYNLGTALARLGEREKGTAHLEEAVAAYREALKEYTRERVPIQWAMTQTDLGAALGMLGERENRLDLICEALGLSAAAWEIFSDSAPAYASVAKQSGEIAIQVMREGFEASKVDECLRRHEKYLKPMLSELAGNQ
ncbi:MAG TPA: hypothetical protein VN494_11845 [Patescibacteria group bacterium]|nr:hypothetical protein [Patescibacteria group bacterium]